MKNLMLVASQTRTKFTPLSSQKKLSFGLGIFFSPFFFEFYMFIKLLIRNNFLVYKRKTKIKFLEPMDVSKRFYGK